MRIIENLILFTQNANWRSRKEKNMKNNKQKKKEETKIVTKV